MPVKYRAEKYVYPCLLALLFLAYFPVVKGYFLAFDDIWSFVYEYHKLRDNHMFKAQAYSAGRPLGAYGMSFLLSFVKTVNHANFVRGFLILLLSGAIFLLYKWLRLAEFNRVNSLFIAVSIGTLPPFYSGIFCITDSYSIYGLLPSITAGLLVYRMPEQKWSAKPFIFMAAVVLLFISLLVYPMAAMFYFTLFWISIAKMEIAALVKRKKQILMALSVPFVSMCIYLGYFKFFQKQYSTNQLNFSLIAKLKWLLIGPLPASLGLWDRPLKELWDPANSWCLYNTKIVFFVCLTIILGLVSGAIKDLGSFQFGKRSGFVMAAKYLILILLLPLSFTPLLFSTWSTLSYRYMAAFSGIVFLSFIWSLYNLTGLVKKYGGVLFTLITASLMLGGIYSANRMVSEEIVRPLSLELRYFKENLRRRDLTSQKLIHIVASEWSFPRMESLGLLSSINNSDWGAALVMAAVKELSLENVILVNPNIYNIGKMFEIVTKSTNADVERGAIEFNKEDSIVLDLTTIEPLVFKSGAVHCNQLSLPWLMAPYLNKQLNMKSQFSSGGQYSDNLCRNGKPISGGDYPGFPAVQAFDGDKVSSRWGSSQTGLNITNAAFIGYDFGENARNKIRRIVIRQGGALAKVRVQRSNDNRLWIDVAELDLNPDSNVRNYDLPVSASSRFWRLLAVSTVSEGPAAWTVYEIEMKEAKETK